MTGSVEELHIELRQFLDVGRGVKFAVNRYGGRPGGSASAVHEDMAVVLVIEDGLVGSLTSYGDINESRTAAERLAQSRGCPGARGAHAAQTVAIKSLKVHLDCERAPGF